MKQKLTKLEKLEIKRAILHNLSYDFFTALLAIVLGGTIILVVHFEK